MRRQTVRWARSLASSWVMAAMLLVGSAPAVASAQSEQMPTDALYRMPDPALTALVDAPATPVVSVSPDRTRLALLTVPNPQSIAHLSQPELRLAGMRINPRTNGPSRDRYYTGLTIQTLADGDETQVTGLPEAVRIGSVGWAPDGAWIAFTVTRDTGIELWAAEVATRASGTRRRNGRRQRELMNAPPRDRKCRSPRQG